MKPEGWSGPDQRRVSVWFVGFVPTSRQQSKISLVPVQILNHWVSVAGRCLCVCVRRSKDSGVIVGRRPGWSRAGSGRAGPRTCGGCNIKLLWHLGHLFYSTYLLWLCLRFNVTINTPVSSGGWSWTCGPLLDLQILKQRELWYLMNGCKETRTQWSVRRGQRTGSCFPSGPGGCWADDEYFIVVESALITSVLFLSVSSSRWNAAAGQRTDGPVF